MSMETSLCLRRCAKPNQKLFRLELIKMSYLYTITRIEIGSLTVLCDRENNVDATRSVELCPAGPLR